MEEGPRGLVSESRLGEVLRNESREDLPRSRSRTLFRVRVETTPQCQGSNVRVGNTLHCQGR
jgi:hypothetical protein